MINKILLEKMLKLFDKVNDLEVENVQLKQTIDFKNREIEQLENNRDKTVNKEVTNRINELKAEVTYWYETAKHWQDVAVEFEFGRHNNDLDKKLNKVFDNYRIKC